MFFDNPPPFPPGVRFADITYTDDNESMRHLEQEYTCLAHLLGRASKYIFTLHSLKNIRHQHLLQPPPSAKRDRGDAELV